MKSFAVIVVLSVVVDVVVAFAVAAFAVVNALATLVAELANCDELVPVCKILSIVIPFLSILRLEIVELQTRLYFQNLHILPNLF